MTVASHGAEPESSSLQPASIHFTCENKNHTQISSHHRHDRDRTKEQESEFFGEKIHRLPNDVGARHRNMHEKKLHISRRRPPRSVLVFVRVFQFCCVFSLLFLNSSSSREIHLYLAGKKEASNAFTSALHTACLCCSIERRIRARVNFFPILLSPNIARYMRIFHQRERVEKKEKCVYSAFSSISNDQSSHISICSTTSTKVRAVSLPPSHTIFRLSRALHTHEELMRGWQNSIQEKKSKRESSSSSNDDDDVDGKVECADEGKGMCGGTRESGPGPTELIWIQQHHADQGEMCRTNVYIAHSRAKRVAGHSFFSAAAADDSAQPSIAFACVAAASNGVSWNRRYRRRLLYAKSEWARYAAEY